MDIEVEFAFQVMRCEFPEMSLVRVVYEYAGPKAVQSSSAERTSSHTTVGDNPIL